MLSNSRFQGLVTACAILIGTVALPGTASAQDEQCKEGSVSASGKGRVGIQRSREEIATDRAIKNWELEVGNRHGPKWRRWSDAKDKNVECEAGKLVGIVQECTVSARPCSVTISGRTGKDGDSDEVVRRKGDRDDRDDRADRRDDSKRGSNYRRKYASSRYEYRGHRTTGRVGSRAYWREMAYQDYLARRRTQSERWAWARENTRQEWLERRRDQFERQIARGYGWYRYRWRDYD